MVKNRRTVRRQQRTISRLQASSDEGERPPSSAPKWAAYRRPNKKQINLYLDADVVAWFKGRGPGYQKRINRVLWEMMKAEHQTSRG